MLGVGNARGCADSSPVWELGGGTVMDNDDDAEWEERMTGLDGVVELGVCDSVLGNDCIASSTFLSQRGKGTLSM